MVADAQITVRNEATGQERTTVSDRAGDYQLSALPVGNYRLEVRSPGFQTTAVSGLRLEVAQAIVQNVRL